MPLYEYQCTVCEHRFEVIQRLSDPVKSSCPLCEEPVRKLISAPAFQFKGSGWYVTDYARKGSTGGSSGSSSEPKEGDGGSKKEKSGEKSSGDTAAKKQKAS